MTNRAIRFAVALAPALGLSMMGASQPSQADEATPAQVVTVTSPLIPWIGTRDRALPGSIATMRQTQPTLDLFGRLVIALVSGRTDAALALQADAGYQIYRSPFEGKDYLVAMDESGAGIGPTVVFNPAPAREIILEAPHGSFELGSGEQATLLMARLGARAAWPASARARH